MTKNALIFVAVITSLLINYASCNLEFIPNTVELSPGECQDVVLHSFDPVLENETISLEVEYSDLASVSPTKIYVNRRSNQTWIVRVCGIHGGFTVIEASIQNSNNTAYYLHVNVAKRHCLKSLSLIIGWFYFLAWSVSFYPQIYSNYVRKSVVGLNFDFIALNLVGFVLYSLFNCGLYFVPFLQYDYFERHPKGLNPVLFNDVFFSVHAIWGQLVIIVQCLLYERNDQRVSNTTKMIIVLYAVIVLVTGTCAYMGTMHWLDFLYYCSYIKLSVTLIKYVPQALMNYKRKSTVGWSVGGVLLDFTGGSFSMMQMLIDGYNFNDWQNILGDPTKFGLGLFSVNFDLFFMYQHYVLYRNPYEEHRSSSYTTNSGDDIFSNASTKEADDMISVTTTKESPALYDVNTD